MSLIAAAAGQPAGEKDSNCDARRTTASNGYSSQERAVRGASLFRPESNTARPSQLYGPVTLARPWSSWVLVGITTVILASGLIYAFLGSYTKRVTVGGVLLPESGVIRIQSAVNGVVQQSFVREGQQVAQGDVLMVVGEDKRIAAGAGARRLA